MKRLPNIELDTEQITELTTEYKITRGSEATICEGIKSGTVAKIFTKQGLVIPMGDNKEKKIIRLYESQLEYSTIPVRTISYKGQIVGYEMTTDPFYNTYKGYELTIPEQKQLLIKSKQVLEYFQSKDIIYGDIELRNILFNRETGEVIFCDMDNTQIGDLPIDVRPSKLNQYYLAKSIIDEGVHPFMHNYLTLRLYGLDPYSTRFAINKQFHKPASKIAHSMKQPVDFIPDYVIKYIKK
ncbi:MAG: hypothetical protein ACI4WW_03665 [Candidatus Coprovivens sp.]